MVLERAGEGATAAMVLERSGEGARAAMVLEPTRERARAAMVLNPTGEGATAAMVLEPAGKGARVCIVSELAGEGAKHHGHVHARLHHGDDLAPRALQVLTNDKKMEKVNRCKKAIKCTHLSKESTV
jgi:hypothetical protein